MILRTKQNYFQQDIKYWEYIAAVGRSIAVISMIAYLYYDSIWALPLLIPVGIWHFMEWKRERVSKKKQEFLMQFQEAVHAISVSLNVGYSIENAVKEAKKDLDILYNEKTAIQREFGYMIHQIHVHIPMEQVFEEWSDRVDQEDVRNFAAVFVTAKKSGGDMIHIIRNAINQIRDKLGVNKEIQTLLSARKYEFKVMSAVPFAMIAYMKVSFPEFVQVLYGNIIGIGVMSVCLGIYIVAYWLGRKLVNIEV